MSLVLASEECHPFGGGDADDPGWIHRVLYFNAAISVDPGGDTVTFRLRIGRLPELLRKHL